jgi:hypothetical protein
MDTYSQVKAYQDPRVDNLDDTGVIDELPILDLSISDSEITKGLEARIQDSKDYWNDVKGYNLENIRNENQKLYLGKHLDTDRLYRHNIPYVQNEIYVGVETIISYVCSQIPQPEVYAAQDTQGSKILAEDIEKVVFAHSEKFNLAKKIEGGTRNMFLKRVGFIKLHFDPNYGRNGEIIPEVIDPEHIIVDKNVKLGENPAFICHNMKASIQELCERYPDKKDKIYEACGIKQGTPKQLSTIVTYREVWITHYEDGKKQEGVVVYLNKTVLSKDKNPNWDYEEDDEGAERTNFLDYPIKPFIPFNYINDGSHWIDQITPVEQATPQQHMLNKRGRQIMENADKANPYQIFSNKALSSDDAQNLTGDTNQKILLDTEDVRSAVTTVQPNLLPSYVIGDKQDLQTTIHSILGTPPQLRGDDNGSQTLGQDLMARNQAMGRQDAIVRAIETSMNLYFRLLVQMMKVWYDEDHYYMAVGENGSYDRIAMRSDKIEDGIDIRVKAGSTLPFDKVRAESVAMNLAKMSMIDPLSLYEDLHMPNAQKRYERLVKYQVDATLLAEDLKEEEADRDAYIDFTTIMGGGYAPPREDVTEEHLKSHQEQLVSGEYKNATPEKQYALQEHIKAETESLAEKANLLALMEPEPMETELGMGEEVPLPGEELQADGMAAPLQEPATPESSGGTDMSSSMASPLV